MTEKNYFCQKSLCSWPDDPCYSTLEPVWPPATTIRMVTLCTGCKSGFRTLVLPANFILNLLFNLPPFLHFLAQIPSHIANLTDDIRTLARFPSSVIVECTDVRRVLGLPLSGDGQENSHEFLTALLKKQESSLGDYSNQFRDIFIFTTKVTITCFD